MTVLDAEIPLPGGNTNAMVVRVGETVRRACGPWSPAVHALLVHLRERQFTGCPRFLGIDEQGREQLTYLPGEVGSMPYWYQGDKPLVATAHLLRAYHDATVDLATLLPAAWQYTYPDSQRHEVICHNDFAPYNLVCTAGQPYAIIDFDMAGPGPRLRDVAYAAYWLVPLSRNVGPPSLAARDAAEGSRRLHAFCAAYGIPATPALLEMVAEVLQHLVTWLETGAALLDPARTEMVRQGHLAHWKSEIAAFQLFRGQLVQNL